MKQYAWEGTAIGDLHIYKDFLSNIQRKWSEAITFWQCSNGISKILRTSLIDVSNVFIMESLKDFSWPLKIPPNNVKDLTRDKL